MLQNCHMIKVKAGVFFFQAPENTDTAARAVQVRVTPAGSSRRCFNIFLLAIALMVLATGIIGGVYLFKYMIHKVCS